MRRPAKLLPLLSLLVLLLATGQVPSAQGVVLPPLKAAPQVRSAGLSATQTARLKALLRYPVRSGVLIADAQSGRTLFSQQPGAAYTPASNMKLLSLAAVLYALGPDEWYGTTLARPLRRGAAAGSVADPLTLVGLGDPSLEQNLGEHSLAGLARQAYRRGLRRVGSLVLDARMIGATPGHAQDGHPLPGWTLPIVERPVTALTINDPSVGEGLQTTAHPDARAALLKLGDQLRAQLRRAGVRVGGGTQIRAGTAGSAPEEGLATTRSAPLLKLVRRALKRSDNVWTEQLYARLGVDTTTPLWRPADPALAAERARALLVRAGATPAELAALRMQDGSGLSPQDRLSPALLLRLLRFVYLHPLSADPPGPGTQMLPAAAFRTRRNAFIQALPRAGTGLGSRDSAEEGGTLATRLSGLDVRAKTGTLPGVSALSGYLTTRSGRILIFSLMMDGYPGPASDLRDLQDRLLRVLAADGA